MQMYRFGVGDKNLGPREQTGSWAFAILPFLEQDIIYQERNWQIGLPVYICRARRSFDPKGSVATDANGNYESGGWLWGRTDYGASRKSLDNRPQQISGANYTWAPPAAHFIDGMSNTIIIGERAYDVTAQGGSWYYDEGYFTGGSNGTSRIVAEMSRDGPNINYKDNWGSPHAEVVNFLFADGTVRGITYGVNSTTMVALMTPNGNEGVSPP
jgi:prepilin-type processing-associated H-X9-DG protein